MQNVEDGLRQIHALEAEAARAAQRGREEEAIRLWGRILQIDPSHARALTLLGQRAFRRGDMQSARATFQRLVDADGTDPQQWINLALACRNLKDEPGEESAIQRKT
jgi:cytochrome c-type biogenesis protein CcmH/NrfG